VETPLQYFATAPSKRFDLQAAAFSSTSLTHPLTTYISGANLDIGKSHQHSVDFSQTAGIKVYKLRHCQ